MAKQENPWQFHQPTENQRAAMQTMRNQFEALAKTINDLTPNCRERASAQTRLEEAAVWANKAANQRDD